MMKKGTRYMDGKEEVVYDSIATIKGTFGTFLWFHNLRTGYLRFSNLDLGTTVKTAHGPYGMNKIVQNHIEKLHHQKRFYLLEIQCYEILIQTVINKRFGFSVILVLIHLRSGS